MMDRKVFQKLSELAGQEEGRLRAAGPMDLRDELLLCIWPFLRELVDVTEANLAALWEAEVDDDGEEDAEQAEPADPDLIAKTIAIIGELYRLAGATVEANPELAALADVADEVIQRWIAYLGPEKLKEVLAASQPASATGGDEGGEAENEAAGG